VPWLQGAVVAVFATTFIGWHGYTAAVCGVAMDWPRVIPAKAGIQGWTKNDELRINNELRMTKKKNGFPLARE